MSAFSVEEHVLYKLCNARKLSYPFPHFFVEDVFPYDFYESLMADLREKSDYAAAEGRYSGRTFGSPDDIEGLEFMKTNRFMSAILSIFKQEAKARYQTGEIKVFTDLRLVRDGAGYEIGPHTDAPWKLVSLLFYLPPDDWFQKHGTSIYVPKDLNVRCAGGPHHAFEDFNRVWTAPFCRNSCFGFWKTDFSFHGVEPVDNDFRRDVLLYNVYDEGIYLQTHKPVAEEGKEPSVGP